MLESGSDPGLPVASRAPSLLATAPPPLLFLLPALGRTPLPHPTPGLHNCASVLGFQGNLRTLLGCCSGPSSGSSLPQRTPPPPNLGAAPLGPRSWVLGRAEGGQARGSAFLINPLEIRRQGRVGRHFASRPLTLRLAAAPLPGHCLPGGTLLPLQTQLRALASPQGLCGSGPLPAPPSRHPNDSVVRGLGCLSAVSAPSGQRTRRSWAECAPHPPHPVHLSFPGPAGPAPGERGSAPTGCFAGQVLPPEWLEPNLRRCYL